MSSASPDPGVLVGLTVEAQDVCSEVLVVDGGMNLRARGQGRLDTALPPGIYTVRCRSGGAIKEELIVLARDAPVTRTYAPLAFVSPAPLQATSRSHEYHEDFAERESRTVHVDLGGGANPAWIFVMARAWTPTGASGKPDLEANPALGVYLRDAGGKVLVDLGASSRVEFTETAGKDACAGCTVRLAPGIYQLARDSSDGGRVVQAVVATQGWQTQVFLLTRPAGADADPDDFPATTIYLTRQPHGGSAIPSFDAGNPILRHFELARLGLTHERQVLPREIIHEILNGKFEDPMLGIFGAHLLARKLKAEPDQGRLADSLPVIVGNLRRLLGPDHPDVEALSLMAGGDPTPFVFRHPPMLRASWALVLEATARRPELVPPDSLASEVSDRFLADAPWLTWSEHPRPAASSIFKSLTIGARPVAEKPGRLVDVMMQELLTPPARVARGLGAEAPLEAISLSVREPAPTPEQEIQRMVRALGIPRGKVERMLREHRPQGILPTSPFANAHALVVGIADYANVRKLPKVKDAEDLAALLGDPAFCGYEPQNVQILLDRDATKDNLLKGLAALGERCDADSTALIYISAHGAQIAVGPGQGSYLLPVDTTDQGVEELARSAISESEFAAALDAIPARRLTVVLDCCHAGGIVEPGAPGPAEPTETGLLDDFLDELKAGRGRVIVSTSRGSDPTIVRDGAEHGVFAGHLLAGLRGAARGEGGVIRVLDLYSYVQAKVVADQPGQRPVLKFDLADNYPIASYRGGKAPAPPSFEMRPDGFVYDVFVGYSPQEPDATWTRKTLLPRLKAAGLKVFLDHIDFRPGAPALKELERAVVQSRYTVGVFSPGYVASNFTDLEGILARNPGPGQGQPRFIGVIREPFKPGPGLRARYYLDMTGEGEIAAAVDRLVAQLRQSPELERIEG